MNNKVKSYLTFVGWTTYVSILILKWNDLINAGLTGGFLVSIAIYYLTNPAYMLITYGIIKYAPVAKWRSTIASVLLVVALDIVSSPRVVSINNALEQCSSMTLDNGMIIMRWLSTAVPLNIAYYLFYWAMPIIIFWLSMELLGYSRFIKKLNNGL